MNQAECKAEAIRLAEYATQQYSNYSDSYRNLVAKAQVYATLALIPDEPVAADTGPR